jgi:transposase
LAPVRPRDLVGKIRRRLAAHLIIELATIDKRIKATDIELRELINGQWTAGVLRHWPLRRGAARLLGDIGQIDRFANKDRFASPNGTAPLDASSGDHQRHRLSRAGNRRINRVLHIMAVVQLRHDTEGRGYYRRKLAAGKTTIEAMRCLKRRLSDIVYRQMARDAQRLAAGPGGHTGAATNSSAADLTPTASPSEQSLPRPANHHPRTPTSSTP